LWPLGEPAPDLFAGAPGDGDGALFGAFSPDGDAAVGEIDIVYFETGQLGGADAGVEEDEDEADVALAVVDAVDDWAGWIFGGGEKGLDV